MSGLGGPVGRRVAVLGGGWAGLCAAVCAADSGYAVTLIEMARTLGGRARSSAQTGLDNGQHILIGAYRETLALMRRVGVDPDDVLHRRPLELRHADGTALALRRGAPLPAFAGAVWRCAAWSSGDKLRLLTQCTRWLAGGFHVDPDRSVAELCAALPASVREALIEPLCVAALNTPAHEASAAVFLRVLRDGLFGGPGASDLLLPRRPLQHLLPTPAARWLERQGAVLRLGHRAGSIEPARHGWLVNGEPFDAVIVATSAVEAARLLAPIAPDWAAQAGGLRFEPILTVYAQGPPLPAPMLALREGPDAPAQFVFDHGVLGGPPGRLAFVISGAGPWLERGIEATVAAVQRQAAIELGRTGMSLGSAPGAGGTAGLQVEQTIAERRATFRCTPKLARPRAVLAPGLVAAGDYVAGPYPATLEGAVRSGIAAVRALDRAFNTPG